MSTGPPTVKVTGPLVPPASVTVMLLGPIVAVALRWNVAVIVVGLTTVTPETVRPFAGATTWIVDPAAKLPVNTTGGFAPRRAEAGPVHAGGVCPVVHVAIEDRTGVPGFTTVNVTGVVGGPVVVTVTFLAVSAAVGGMVKFAVMVVSLTTVKPLTVMVPPVPPEIVIPVAGFAPVTKLWPVSVTAWVVPRAPVVGEIENSPTGGTITVKVTALLVPAGPEVVTFLAPAVAPPPNKNVAVTWVSLTTVTALTVTPPPDTFTAVVPVNPVPVRVTGIAVPRVPEAGPVQAGGVSVARHDAMEVSTGPVIANGRVLLAPPAVTTSMFTLPIGVAPPPVAVLVKVAVMEVALTTTTLLMLKPDTAGAATTVDPVTKFVPVRVTFVGTPRSSELGEMDVSVGAGVPTTVNVTALLVAPPTVTVTFRAVNEAFAGMLKVAVTSVALTATKLVTVIAPPPPPLTFTAVAPVRFWPPRTTFTDVPWLPELGVIELRIMVGVLLP